jgi:hypothetical protein
VHISWSVRYLLSSRRRKDEAICNNRETTTMCEVQISKPSVETETENAGSEFELEGHISSLVGKGLL